MDDDQQFCLRWNNHQSTLVSVFDTLLEKGIHVDCTLAAEGQTLKAHKVVLSACSPYFESVLSQQYDKHPIIILKDVKYAELRAMMDYMYRGEVNISQDQLAALLKAAESLQIKGLSDNKPSRPPSRPAQAVVAHPPRVPSPPPQVRDGSIDSREGSVSPTRRRKKARRMSTETAPVPIPPATDTAQGNGDETQCKEEVARDGVEDLTLDEEAEEQPTATHNDVVRNFQWHMERSQDDVLNSSDSVRESQGRKTTPRHSIMTRSKKVTEEASATTLAILKNVRTSNSTPEDAKENKKQSPAKTASSPGVEPSSECRLNVFPRHDRNSQLPCAQYKTEKGYKCPNCQRCYNARKNLVRHVTLECGREPQYKCPYCAYSKHRRNELKKHIDKKHPDHQSPEARRDDKPA
ncbi:longitudinals lacking protein, isoforms F/I/K/T-like isoform X3 [Achroia grisella]|uniref:longitudinals lacking protein, isoforms F/I/K/T-like isoform X3 n=1 Tax=Achroia grisella TaxID=688607 RepID=UPI0027D2BD04|nr:longitudinals lacking protein, isoforms F/I/K/T-like isoform X3 [Achroia grisella]